MSQMFTQRFKGSAGRVLGADDSGSTLVEFVMTLPAMLIIFAGIGHLGALSAESVVTGAMAHAEAFDAMARAQVMDAAELLQSNQQSPSQNQGSRLLPATAAASAVAQLYEHPPLIEDDVLRAAVFSADSVVYTPALAMNGHWGEMVARTKPFSYVVKLSPVDQARSMNTKRFFGPAGAGSGGSTLARRLFFDGPNLSSFDPTSTSTSGPCAGQGIGGYLTSAANGLLTGFGVRPALAGSMQYGTITGYAERQLESGTFSATSTAYLNLGMAPHTLTPNALQPFITTAVTRLALESPTMQPYSGLLGVSGQEQCLPQQVGMLQLDKIPTPQEVGFAYPLDY